MIDLVLLAAGLNEMSQHVTTRGTEQPGLVFKRKEKGRKQI